jgi:ribosomal protein L37AE/L43A
MKDPMPRGRRRRGVPYVGPHGAREGVIMLGQFRNRQLSVELRPQCPKCRKEFVLDLRKFVPGGARSCHACGTVVQFDAGLAEKVQKALDDLEGSIGAVLDSLSGK